MEEMIFYKNLINKIVFLIIVYISLILKIWKSIGIFLRYPCHISLKNI